MVEKLIMREAQKLVDQNNNSAMISNKKQENKSNRFMKNEMLDGLDEIEDLEDLEVSGKGFHFYGAGANQKQPQAGPTIVANKSPMGSLA